MIKEIEFRVFKLKHSEIETIENALEFSANKILEDVNKNRIVLGDILLEKTIKHGTKYVNLKLEISNGEKDI